MLPAASVAVHVTVVTPIGKTVGASLVTVGVPQLSENTGVPNVTLEAVGKSASVFTATATGAVVTVGSIKSSIVSTKVSTALRL